MNKLMLLITLFVSLGFNTVLAQCPAGDVIFQNQFQVDYFIEQCPTRDTIEGSLIIGDYNSNINDLSGLSFIRIIQGGLTIQHNDTLENLLGLDSIYSIEGWLTIGDNKFLDSITHLEGITTITGDLIIQKNDSLLRIDGLKNISSVSGDILIDENPMLSSLMGLNEIQTTTGSIRIHNNDTLSTLYGLDSLTSIGGGLSIKNNHNLQNINGLDSLHSIGSSCSISENSSVLNLNAFESLLAVGQDLYIGSNSSLSDCTGICNLLNEEGVGGSIAIGGNPSECSNNNEVLPICNSLVALLQPTQNSFTITPNPANQYLQIRFNSPVSEITDMSILSVAGKRLPLLLAPNGQLDISNLIPGLYILSVKTKDNVILQKFIVD